MPRSEWPRDFVLMCSRGYDYKGRPGKHPVGTVVGVFEEDVWEQQYASAVAEPQCKDLLDTWIQRVTINNQSELDDLMWSVSQRAEKIDLEGIDKATKSSLQTRGRFANRGKDGRVRTVKGRRTRDKHEPKPTAPKPKTEGVRRRK